MSVSRKPMVLVILDGYGYREEMAGDTPMKSNPVRMHCGPIVRIP
ncbi:hypothetical protein DJICPGNB_18160 [Escherichia coli]|nr:hypothetical protein DJICPGNB_18160 [Escherichia coli]